jgi:hypothetical protein
MQKNDPLTFYEAASVSQIHFNFFPFSLVFKDACTLTLQ